MARKTLLLFAWLIAGLLIYTKAGAQWNYEMPTQGVLTGTNFAVGEYTEVVDDKFGTPFWSTIENNYRKKAVVSLFTRENAAVVFPASFSCEVTVSIDWWDAANTLHNEVKKLAVNFDNDTLHNDTLISYYTFADAHKVKVTIVDIYTQGLSTPIPDIFTVTADLLFERDYDFSCTQYAEFGDTEYISSNDELRVQWTTFNSFLTSLAPGINFNYDHECDLEWTFYDDSSDIIKQYLNAPTHPHPYTNAAFKRNATRVVVDGYEYKIPLLYSSGYLMFRIRPVKVLPSGQRITGDWTTDIFPHDSRFIYKLGGHEDKLNWQAATTFAEEGKRKSVISYFDGSSKNRQTVTKVNTDNMAVVAETIYDNEGRPVIAVLPSPAFSSAIQHFDSYNKNLGGQTYSWHDLYNSQGCIPGPDPMSNTSGSSKYYSYNNPLQATLPHSNIPEAFNFPFSQTQYTNDLTNRVRASAGPGKDHNFGAPGERYTKYYYAGADQQDLKKMFGNEAGVMSHYFKNMVVDPNGQVSVTYQDMHGRTIATALSGDVVNADLAPLDENSDTVMFRDAIIDTANQSTSGLSINVNKTFLVSRRAVHKFYYSLFPESFSIKACDSANFCYDCVYDLKIRVTDECGNEIYLLTKRNYTPSDALGFYYDTSCANEPLPIVDSFEVTLGVGEYTVSKSLTIQQEAIDFYYNDYLSKDTCIQTFDDFYNAALSELDFTGCEFNCQSCLLALGDSADYVHNFLEEIIASDDDGVLSARDTANAISGYRQLKNVCKMLCDSLSICDAKLGLMLHDMSPTGGQYANYVYDGSNDTYVFDGATSILSPNATIFHGYTVLPLYTDPSVRYRDEMGVLDTVFLDTDGDGVLEAFLPNQLSGKQFIENWKPSWAEALVTYHPEYCDYLYCVSINSSHEYDQHILQIEDYQTAVDGGFLNPMNDVNSEVPFPTSSNPDPFFVSHTTRVHDMVTNMREYIHGTYIDNLGATQSLSYSIWELASLSAQCAPATNTTCGTCTQNFYWNTFRDIYIGMKRKWVEEQMVNDYPSCCQSLTGTSIAYPDFTSGPLAGYTPRFELAYNLIDSINNNILDGDTDDMQAAAEQIVNDNSFDCSSYSNYWWHQIEGCGFALADSAAIIDQLIQVCRLGTDDQHKFGASTTANPADHAVPSGANSFEGVLQWAEGHFLVNNHNFPGPECSQYLINNPQPHSVTTVYYQNAQVDKPAQCVCDNIDAAYTEYQASSQAASMNFGDYLTNIKNIIVTDDDIQMLMASCHQNICNILERPVALPYQFGCDQICANCAQVTAAYQAFLNDPNYHNVHLHPNYITLLQSYMNSALSMNLTVQEYFAFMHDSCGYTNFPPYDDTIPAPAASLVRLPQGAKEKTIGNPVKTGGYVPFSKPLPKGLTTSLDEMPLPASVPANSIFSPRFSSSVPDVMKLVERYIPVVNVKASLYARTGLNKAKWPVAYVRTPVSNLPAAPSAKQLNDVRKFFSLKNVSEPYNRNMPHLTGVAAAGSVSNPINSYKTENNLFSNTAINTTANAGYRNTGLALTAGAALPDVQKAINRAAGVGQPVAGAGYGYVNSAVTAMNSNTQGTGRPVQLQGNAANNHFSSQRRTGFNNHRLQLALLGNVVNPGFSQQGGHRSLAETGNMFAMAARPAAIADAGTRQSNLSGQSFYNNLLMPGFNSFDARGRNTSSPVIQYSIQPQANWCDSVAASIAVFDSAGNHSSYDFSFSMQDNLGVWNSLEYWLQVVDSCNLPCPHVINCARADSMMQLFKSVYPQYADSCLPTIWVAYMNQYNGSGYGNSFTASEWMSLLDCCNVSYPAPNNGGSYCSNMQAIASFFFMQGTPAVLGQLNNQFGISHYDTLTNTWLTNDVNYWLAQFDTCGMSCSQLVNCEMMYNAMSSFRNTYPQYADSCLPFIWVTYLNQYNVFGPMPLYYSHNEWVAMLNCCGLSFPAEVSATGKCDSILAIVSMYQSQGITTVVNQLQNQFGYYHYDSATDNWVYNDQYYWLQVMDSCGISCSTFYNCSAAASVMQQFRSQYPQYANNCLASIWVNYLNQNNATGTGMWLSETEWLSVLNCCAITYPASDSLNSYCDTLQALVNFYQPQGLSNLVNQLNNQFGWNHYDSVSGNWIYNDFGYWLAKMAGCGISCSSLVNCSSLNTVMQQFRMQYPQYADTSLAYLWVDYLNQNNASGNWNSYGYGDWVAMLNCCGVTYPVANTNSSRCDTIQGIVSFYQNQGLSNVVYRLNDQFGWSHFDAATNMWVSNDMAYWLGQMDSCGISCSAFVNCGRVDTLMQQFRSQYPQYADSSISSLWVNYLNQNNASGNYNWYNAGEWVTLLNCCGINYPVVDSNSDFCHILSFTVDFYKPQGANSIVNGLNNQFGGNHYDPATNSWLYNDLAYWLTRMDSCGISCSSIFDCGRADTVLQQFRTQYPQYADTCFLSIWTNYLNQNNASGNGNYFSDNDWLAILNCCNISYPVNVLLGNRCDTINSLITFYRWQGINTVVDKLNGQLGYSHYDMATNMWVSNDLSYWIAQLSDCGIPCSELYNCGLVDSVMNQFYIAYPNYTQAAPSQVWTNYLNQNGAGGGNWYSTSDWLQIFACCNITPPAEDSLSGCASVAAVVAYFNQTTGNHSLWDFSNTMAMNFGWGYNDTYGNWVSYDYNHWFALLDSCNIPCPNIINCNQASTVLNEFYALYPYYTQSAPGFLWANYLNSHQVGNGNWYNEYEWTVLLHCCGITVPPMDTVGDFCDMVHAVINSDSTLSELPDLHTLYQMRQVFGWGYNDPRLGGDFYQYPLSYYIHLLDSCDIPCSVLTDCAVLDSALQQFYTANPVYADSCPNVIIEDYLNRHVLNDQDWLDYDDWRTMAECCGIPFPEPDSTFSRCDSAFMFNQGMPDIQAFLDTLNQSCAPAWLLNVLLMESGNGITIDYVCSIMDSCGYACPEFCVLNDYCDSLASIVHIYNVITRHNGGDDNGDGGDDMQLIDIVNVVMGTSMTEEELQMQLILCDSSYFCDAFSEPYQNLDTLFSSYDSCVPANVYLGVLNGMTSLNFTYETWCNFLAECNITCPTLCTDSLGDHCDTVKQAYDTYLRVIANYQIGDSADVLSQVFSMIFHYGISDTLAQEMVNSCIPGNCGQVADAAATLQPLLAAYGDCVPAWVVEYVYTVTLHPDGPQLNYAQICSLLAACNIPCPDTCVTPPVPPISCDSIREFDTYYQLLLEVYGSFGNHIPDAALYYAWSQSYFGYEVPYWQYQQMLDSCNQICDSTFINIYNEYNPFFQGFGSCTPSWAIEFIYTEILEMPVSYDRVCHQLGICAVPCPDTCAPPVTSCDTIMQIQQAMQSVFDNYGAEDTTYLLNLFSRQLLGDTISRELYEALLDSCRNDCANVHEAYDNFQPFFAAFDSCVPAWIVVAAYNSENAASLLTYPQICAMLAACGLPCPDTCSPVVTHCDTIIQIYNALQNIFNTFEVGDSSNPTQYLTQTGLGVALTWPQFLNIYHRCVNEPEPLLCNRPLLPPLKPEVEDSCFELLQQYAYHNAAWAYNSYIENLHADFVNGYIDKCLGAYKRESFDYDHSSGEYHYTLYYYDQAGNLVKTIPPAGFVNQLTSTLPHNYPTVYRYNTLNQLVEQHTPDAGTSRFWYDRIGKLTFSQNQKQYQRDQMSYTLYDKLQRIIEVGRFDSLGIDNTYAPLEALAQSSAWYSFIATYFRAKEITRTYYDEDIYATGGRFLRNRLASATYEDVEDFNLATYQAASHYDYDVHGNVKKLVQVNPRLAAIGQSEKVVEYKYDLISGKVNEVMYQRGAPDQFIHQYEYDADNRITDVYTSRDSTVFAHDANYQYYLHGPLARTQLGGNLITGAGSVQGLDYTYTLQGWLKGVNSSALTTATDPGRDGIGTFTARDEFGFTLGYYNGDFQPIGWGSSITAANSIEADITNLNQSSLYNGNIASMAVNVRKLNAPLAYKFHYDLLNRLVNTDAFDGLDPALNQWANNTALTAYHNELTYDPNGNIITNKRNGTATTPDMDDMEYHYYPATNKLKYVSDNVAAGNYAIDIDDQSDYNYLYDSIGNLTKDRAEGIDTILWNLYGKIWEIYKANGDTLRFAYDPAGNRIMKEYWSDSLQQRKQTFYVRDATGNTMATYDFVNDTLTLDELVLYGSSRLGVVEPKLQLSPALAAVTDPFVTGVSYSLINQKQYELSNHLGNVLATLGDRRIPVYSPTFDHYEVDVVSAQDYYPFGMVMPEREYTIGGYRFGYNGQEKDDEVKGKGNSLNFKFRMYDTRLGRFFAVDPLTKKYPWYTPYQFAGNSPIEARELEGLEPSHTKQKSPAEGRSEATLEDGDYFSDVQDQTYTSTFSGVSQEKFNEVFQKFSTDPGSVINNDRATYRLVDRDGSYGVTEGDHFDISIKGGPDGYVVVKSVIKVENSVTVTVQTLRGHPDAGTNTFTLKYDPETKTVTWQTHNVSRTNDNWTAGIGAGIMSARSKQQMQWKDVAKRVYGSLGNPKVTSANANVKEYDYNDATNSIGDIEQDECFEEDFSSEFPKQ